MSKTFLTRTKDVLKSSCVFWDIFTNNNDWVPCSKATLFRVGLGLGFRVFKIVYGQRAVHVFEEDVQIFYFIKIYISYLQVMVNLKTIFR